MTKPSNTKSATPQAEYRGLLPAMAGIALYMFVLAGVVGFGAATGRFPRIFLILCVLFVAAAVGLTLPGVTRVYPWLVSCAAAGIMIVMISATMFHIMRGEVSSAIITAVLLLLATSVAYMRWKVLPIRPRTFS